ncbi:Wzz/FepE/Etk N-terminal domain-containing protein [Anaerococcus hydrogenalis]|uniref:YveK family protein n=1 Tax=Anaerococcus hydrogenalis TaxID=33029 RepID=UPI0028FF1188|nr:Wzz/FepE/Etk N-terminal domain-containing protein [Anaerococcus hydrogenalis]MDU1315750.1 Wzz/FepE/Etk N-terminal domain-containing protein [Anaerococcus hydrogenalis]
MDEREIDLLELVKKLRQHLFSILCLGVIFAALSYAASVFIITPKYEATTTMIVSNSKNEDPNQDVDLNQINANRALVSTYSEIVKSKGVADKVIDNLKLNMDYGEFSQKVSIEPVKDTQIISVKVVDTVPERSMDIANATSMVFKDSVTKIMKVDNVQILDKANLPEKPASPNIKKNTLIGLVLGFIIGIALALFKELSDTTFKTTDDIQEAFDIPVLGMIPDKSKGE